MTSWADHAMDALARKERVVIRPRGSSMLPLVKSGAKVTLAPPTQLEVGSIVLVRVSGRIYLHKVTAIQGDRYTIGNNKGHINGTVGLQNIFGVAVEIDNDNTQ